jgi:hypothetical protein
MRMIRRRGPTCPRSARRGPAAPPSGVIRARPGAPPLRRPLIPARPRPRAVPRARALRAVVRVVLVARAARPAKEAQAVIAVRACVLTAPACVLTAPACVLTAPVCVLTALVRVLTVLACVPAVPGALGSPGPRGATAVPRPRNAPAVPNGPAMPSVQTALSGRGPTGPRGTERRTGLPVRGRPRRGRSGPSGRKPRPTPRRTCRPTCPVSGAAGATVLKGAGPCGPRPASGGDGS